ncbi:MAG: response regulator [Gammaproteobacteria bacterium]
MNFLPAPILVVDDDPDNRALLSTYLTAEGYAVVEADTGEKALEILAKGPAALVLLDVMLPGLSGFDVCRRIKRDAKTAATPVVMVTALGDTQSRTKAFDSDADEIIAKPVFGRELLARVHAILRLRRQSEAARAGGEPLEALLSRYLPQPAVARLMQMPAAERDALLQRVLRAGVPDT